MDVRIEPDPATWAAGWMARRLRAAVKARGTAAIAVSGGTTAPPMLRALADMPGIAWDAVGVWQVDERVAPDGHPDRNASQLDDLPGRHHLMPVTAADLRRAARRYAGGLPERFDVVHLGIGPDGHTASWPPGDPVADSERPVDLSGEYQGRVRMTLTPPVVNAARARLVLVTGADKAEPVASFVQHQGDHRTLPALRISRRATVVVLDPAAAQRLEHHP